MIAIIKKLIVTVMDGMQSSGMFDRTPVLFCSGHNFLEIGDQSIEVCTVGIVQFFDRIKVIQALPIKIT